MFAGVLPLGERRRDGDRPARRRAPPRRLRGPVLAPRAVGARGAPRRAPPHRGGLAGAAAGPLGPLGPRVGVSLPRGGPAEGRQGDRPRPGRRQPARRLAVPARDGGGASARKQGGGSRWGRRRGGRLTATPTSSACPPSAPWSGACGGTPPSRCRGRCGCSAPRTAWRRARRGSGCRR